MRNGLTLMVAAAAVSGCSLVEPAEWGACRSYLESKLKAPSTLKVIKTSSVDVPYPNPTYKAVSIEYDAANAFGTPIRGTQTCSFPLRDGKPVVSLYIDHDSEVNNVLSGTGIYDPSADLSGESLERQADRLREQASGLTNDLEPSP